MRVMIVFLLSSLGWISPCLSSVTFDGADDYINAGTSSTLSFTSSTSTFSICAWVYPTAYNFTNCDIVAKWLGTGNQRQYMFDVNSSNGLSFLVSTNGSSVAMTVDTTSAVVGLNAWYHVCVTADIGADSYLLYASGSSAATSGSTTISSLFDSSSNVNIGSGKDGTDDRFTGKIDDVRIYNRVLSAVEILEMASDRLKYGPITNGMVGYWPLDDQPDGTSFDGDTAVDRSGTGNNGTGVDGDNNTGLTAGASSLLSYPWGAQ